jgi:hypothetical protein
MRDSFALMQMHRVHNAQQQRPCLAQLLVRERCLQCGLHGQQQEPRLLHQRLEHVGARDRAHARLGRDGLGQRTQHCELCFLAAVLQELVSNTARTCCVTPRREPCRRVILPYAVIVATCAAEDGGMGWHARLQTRCF